MYYRVSCFVFIVKYLYACNNNLRFKGFNHANSQWTVFGSLRQHYFGAVHKTHVLIYLIVKVYIFKKWTKPIRFLVCFFKVSEHCIMESDILNIEDIVMGRAVPDPPPEVPAQKPAQPYKPTTFNGPPPTSVQPCKWCCCLVVFTSQRRSNSRFDVLRSTWKPAVFSVLYHVLQRQSQGEAHEEEPQRGVQTTASAGTPHTFYYIPWCYFF